MTPEAWGVILGGGGLFSGLAALLTFLATRGKTKADARASLDARIDGRVETELKRVWAQIDQLRTEADERERADARRTAAMTRILRAIAAQWPTTDGPNLDPADIADIEDTIPPAWIRRSPKGSS